MIPVPGMAGRSCSWEGHSDDCLVAGAGRQVDRKKNSVLEGRIDPDKDIYAIPSQVHLSTVLLSNNNFYRNPKSNSFWACLIDLNYVWKGNTVQYNIKCPFSHATGYFFIKSFFASGVGNSLPYFITQWSCSASELLWEMPDLNPGPLCPRSLVHYKWWAITPPNLKF